MFLRNGRWQILRIYSDFRRNQSKSGKNKGCSEHALTNQPETNAMAKRKLAALNRFLSKAAERALPCIDTLKKCTNKKCTNKKDFHWTIEAEELFQAMKKLIAELPTLIAPKKEEELMVYLSAANEAVSAVLLLTLALVHAARQLRRYFQGHTIKVITDKPISKILNNQEETGRFAKWGVELEAYDIKYASRSTIKGQVLADFLANTMTEDSPTQVKTDGSDDTIAEGESMEEQEDTETKAPKNLKTETDMWKLYTDAASNEHRSGAALLAGLRIATNIKVEKMHAFVDSKLVANQVEGSYEAKGEKIKKYKEKSLEMIRSFSDFQISHIPREENKKADALSKLAAVQCEGLPKGVLIKELNERSVDITEVNAIIKEATRNWMTPIQEYIKKRILPEDATEARTI
ncbi:reverse transcriptase domain-containing protein [Tanacetum coccineum]